MVGFREQLLNEIYNYLCMKLVIEQSEISYQNNIPGYSDLNRLKIGDENNRISVSTSGNTYLVPRRPKLPEFNTPLRSLLNRPITQVDVAGLKVDSSKKPLINTPSAFMHIVTAEKDLYFPSRRIPADGRIKDQIEFLKIGIDCVLRDETDPIIGTSFEGNGKYWHNQIKLCTDMTVVKELPDITGLSLPQGYVVPYHKPINQQAVGFVEDTERILNAGTFRQHTYKYGPNEENEAVVMNVLLAIWGMLPDAENSPTDTVRCVYEFEIHYPKIPGIY